MSDADLRNQLVAFAAWLLFDTDRHGQQEQLVDTYLRSDWKERFATTPCQHQMGAEVVDMSLEDGRVMQAFICTKCQDLLKRVVVK